MKSDDGDGAVDQADTDCTTAEGITPSFSSSSTMAHGTTEDDLTAMEKITKLKTQWMELTP